jgi:hypothetical protein
MGAPRPLELLAVGAQGLDLRGVNRAFDIELCPAGIDLTMRFADLLPLGGLQMEAAGICTREGAGWWFRFCRPIHRSTSAPGVA